MKKILILFLVNLCYGGTPPPEEMPVASFAGRNGTIDLLKHGCLFVRYKQNNQSEYMLFNPNEMMCKEFYIFLFKLFKLYYPKEIKHEHTILSELPYGIINQYLDIPKISNIDKILDLLGQPIKNLIETLTEKKYPDNIKTEINLSIQRLREIGLNETRALGTYGLGNVLNIKNIESITQHTDFNCLILIIKLIYIFFNENLIDTEKIKNKVIDWFLSAYYIPTQKIKKIKDQRNIRETEYKFMKSSSYDLDAFLFSRYSELTKTNIIHFLQKINVFRPKSTVFGFTLKCSISDVSVFEIIDCMNCSTYFFVKNGFYKYCTEWLILTHTHKKYKNIKIFKEPDKEIYYILNCKKNRIKKTTDRTKAFDCGINLILQQIPKKLKKKIKKIEYLPTITLRSPKYRINDSCNTSSFIGIMDAITYKKTKTDDLIIWFNKDSNTYYFLDYNENLGLVSKEFKEIESFLTEQINGLKSKYSLILNKKTEIIPNELKCIISFQDQDDIYDIEISFAQIYTDTLKIKLENKIREKQNAKNNRRKNTINNIKSFIYILLYIVFAILIFWTVILCETYFITKLYCIIILLLMAHLLYIIITE